MSIFAVRKVIMDGIHGLHILIQTAECQEC